MRQGLDQKSGTDTTHTHTGDGQLGGTQPQGARIKGPRKTQHHLAITKTPFLGILSRLNRSITALSEMHREWPWLEIASQEGPPRAAGLAGDMFLTYWSKSP